MKSVFADTGYWVAILNPRDELHAKARDVSRSLGQVRIVTTEMVLTELLNALVEEGSAARTAAATLVSRLREDAGVRVIEQTGEQFAEALALYQRREDKGWSLTDCASFGAIWELKIVEALAYDHHFVQAGIAALLRD